MVRPELWNKENYINDWVVLNIVIKLNKVVGPYYQQIIFLWELI